VIGSTMRARPAEQKMTLARAAAAELVPLFERVLLRPVIDRVYSFDEIAAAHARMEADENVGKIILRW
jgi:NADPH:quinone reductase-like Zn-dependent oxidoreductase